MLCDCVFHNFLAAIDLGRFQKYAYDVYPPLNGMTYFTHVSDMTTLSKNKKPYEFMNFLKIKLTMNTTKTYVTILE